MTFDPSSDNREKEASAPPPARLGRALRAGVRETWDRLGLVIAASLTWAILLLAALSLSRLLLGGIADWLRNILGLACATLLLAAPMAGIHQLAHQAFSGEEVAYGDLWSAARRLFGPALRLGATQAIVLAVASVNLVFYLTLRSVFGMTAALICLYALLTWGMMAVYQFPLLVAQEAGVFDEPERPARRGAFAAIRRSFFLALGNPLPSFGLLFAAGVATALCFGTAVLMVMLWPGLIAMLTTASTRALLVQYGVLPPPPASEEIVPDEKFRIQTEKTLGQD